MDELPLGRALTIAVRLLVDDMHDRLAERGFADLRPAHGYVLNAAAGDGATASEIAALLGITKQGAAKVVAELVDSGYVTRSPSGSDRRARPVTLTARGSAALAAAAEIQRQLEREWAALSSDRDIAALRRVLARVLAAHDVEGRPPPLRPAW
jgi:DNA-binding MarR family transcriptional regulator